MEITRREAVKALMGDLYALAHVSGVTPVKSETLFLLLTVNDGIEFDDASIKNMSEELRDVLAKSGCPNLPVFALYGTRIHALCGPVIPEPDVLPNL
jgi:hypothetical protein